MGYEEEAEIGTEGTELAPAPNSRLSLCSRSCVLACLKKKKKEEKRRKREKKRKNSSLVRNGCFRCFLEWRGKIVRPAIVYHASNCE